MRRRPRRAALSTAKPERKFETKHEGDIPEGRDGLVGTSREEEIYTTKFGQELYDREASAYYEEGTKENPICILSESHERIVGISLTVRADRAGGAGASPNTRAEEVRDLDDDDDGRSNGECEP